MAENGLTEVGKLITDAEALSGIIRARTKRAYRDLDELRRLTAQHEAVLAELVTAFDTTLRIRLNGTHH